MLIEMNTVEETQLVTKNLTNLKVARPELQNLRISTDRSLKERKEVRIFVIKANNLDTSETGDYIHVVRDKQLLRVRKNKGFMRTG